jgi:nucleoid-associated protein YgaU
MAGIRDEMEDLKRRGREKAETSTYVVKSGDTLSKIAKDLLGDAERWPEILAANKDKIKDPDAIKPGQELKIPS